MYIPVHEQHLSAVDTEVTVGVGCRNSSLQSPPTFHSPLHSDAQEDVVQAPIDTIKMPLIVRVGIEKSNYSGTVTNGRAGTITIELHGAMVLV